MVMTIPSSMVFKLFLAGRPLNDKVSGCQGRNGLCLAAKPGVLVVAGYGRPYPPSSTDDRHHGGPILSSTGAQPWKPKDQRRSSAVTLSQ